jgi:hypothetical protein
MKTPIAVALATTIIAAGITAGYAHTTVPAKKRCHHPVVFCTGVFGHPCPCLKK